MRIVIAPDKFKGSLSAGDVAEAIGRGALRAAPDARIDRVPVADGGEGTVKALIAAAGGRELAVYATDPLGRRIEASFGLFADAEGGKTAVVEMAAASGLSLVGEANRPLEASTYGTGELIMAALAEGPSRIIVGIGDSATTDGGVGMATALGARFSDIDGEIISGGGGRLARLERIELAPIDKRLASTKIEVACDVDNPLFGQDGAAYSYAPQKGATAAEVKELDLGLRRLAEVIRRDLDVDIAGRPGAGAAGGLGAGLVAFTGASLRPGFELISKAVGLEERIAGADLVITGEGRLDRQTLRGKAPAGVAKLAKAAGVPVAAIVGYLGEGADEVGALGLTAVETLAEDAEAAARSSQDAAPLIEAAAERLTRKLMGT